MKVSAIIAAGGSGKRLESEIPKQFIELKGIPVIIRTLKKFQENPNVTDIIISVHIDWIEHAEALTKSYNIFKAVDFIAGGQTRQESVFNALQSDFIKNADIVMIHDAARPFISQDLINRLIKSANRFDSVIPAIAAKDTLKTINNDSFVDNTPDRSAYVLVQTPQVFHKELIVKCYNDAQNYKFMNFTDDSSIVEFMNHKVKCINGEEENFKITTKTDLLLAELMCSEFNQ